jgi:hypothetical protein
MGINNTNVRFVVHQTICKSMVSYCQQSGRAGRDGAFTSSCACLLLRCESRALKRSRMRACCSHKCQLTLCVLPAQKKDPQVYHGRRAHTQTNYYGVSPCVFGPALSSRSVLHSLFRFLLLLQASRATAWCCTPRTTSLACLRWCTTRPIARVCSACTCWSVKMTHRPHGQGGS